MSPSTDDDRQRILAAIAQPSYTPGRRDLPLVASLVTDEQTVAAATRALIRADHAAAVDALAGVLASASEPGAARVVAALGQVARVGATTPSSTAAITRIVDLLASEETPRRVQRAAIVALGKIGGDVARAALCARATRPLSRDLRKAIVEALAKVGGHEAERQIAELTPQEPDADLDRAHGRARLIAERDRQRDRPSRVRGEVPPPADITVICRCRVGLEEILSSELESVGLRPTRTTPGTVHVHGRHPLNRFLSARTWTTIGIAAPAAGAADDMVSDTAHARIDSAGMARQIADVITASSTRAILAALTEGLVRWRLELAGAGHRRALVWETARLVRAATPDLVNDPSATTWDVVVPVSDTGIDGPIELRPRRQEDTRFSWRVADVPAASHPTVAAAIARVAGVAPDDVVWDPFCGSGAELVERALLGPYRRLVGTDLDARALAAAQANFEAARIAGDLVLADATTFDPGSVSVIVTNPPLGRRLRGDPGGLLERFVANAARRLGKGGRLVWITPVVARTEVAARRAGLRLDRRWAVDLGGYVGHLERWLR